MSSYIAIIGHPLAHSLSPVFQQAALDYCQLDIKYVAKETKPEELEAAIAGLRLPDSLGANVTVPYKERVLPLMDGTDYLAGRIGAVNTIVSRNGRLTGYNTDAYGFIEALRRKGCFAPRGKKALLLGAGGAARGVAFALAREGASLVIANRTLSRAESLAEDLAEEGASVTSVPLASVDQRVARDCQLIVNCTTVGTRGSPGEQMSPLPVESIPPTALVYDLVYNPPETPFLRLARQKGAATLNGLPMLVYQGSASFELWTGRTAPVEVMFESVHAAARGR